MLALGFNLLARGNVAEDDAYRRIAGADFVQIAVELHMKNRAIAALQGEFQTVLRAGCFHVHEMLRPAILVFRNHERSKAPAQQRLAFHAQQPRAGEVDFRNHAVGGKGEIAGRGELIQIHVAVTRFPKRNLRLPQGLVLHFQLDLMHLQLMQQVVARARRGFGQSGCCELRLGRRAQLRVVRLFFVGRVHGVFSASSATIASRISSVFPAAVTMRRALSTMRCGPSPGKSCCTT